MCSWEPGWTLLEVIESFPAMPPALGDFYSEGTVSFPLAVSLALKSQCQVGGPNPGWERPELCATLSSKQHPSCDVWSFCRHQPGTPADPIHLSPTPIFPHPYSCRWLNTSCVHKSL